VGAPAVSRRSRQGAVDAVVVGAGSDVLVEEVATLDLLEVVDVVVAELVVLGATVVVVGAATGAVDEGTEPVAVSGDRHGAAVGGGAGWSGMVTVGAQPKFDRRVRRLIVLPSAKRSVAVTSRMKPAASIPMCSSVPEYPALVSSGSAAAMVARSSLVRPGASASLATSIVMS
jgi:hypothetical protein